MLIKWKCLLMLLLCSLAVNAQDKAVLIGVPAVPPVRKETNSPAANMDPMNMEFEA